MITFHDFFFTKHNFCSYLAFTTFKRYNILGVIIMNIFKNFFTLGKLSVSYVMHKIFYIGILIIAYKAYIFGKTIYLTHTYAKWIPDARFGNQIIDVNNTPLAILGFIVYLVVVLIIWKFICELLIKFFSYFES